MWNENLSVTQRDVVKQAVRCLVHSLSAYIKTSKHKFLFYGSMIISIFSSNCCKSPFSPISMYRVQLICYNRESSFTEAHCVVAILQSDQVEMDCQGGGGDFFRDCELLHVSRNLSDHSIRLLDPTVLVEQSLFLVKKSKSKTSL